MKKLLAISLLIGWSGSASAVVDCDTLDVSGTYKAAHSDSEITFSPIAYTKNTYAVDGKHIGEGYSIAILTNSYIRGGKLNCAIAFYNPAKKDFWFSLIGQQKKSGDLVLGRDTPNELEESPFLLIKQ